jgi:hypothetical protein
LHQRQLIEAIDDDLDNYLFTPGESPIIGCTTGLVFTEELVKTMSTATLLELMITRQFQKSGHKPLILVRGAKDDKCTAVRNVLEKFLKIEEVFNIASTDATLVHQPNEPHQLMCCSNVKVIDVFQFLSTQKYASSLTIQQFNVMVHAADNVVKLHRLKSLTVLFGMKHDSTIPFAIACGLKCNAKFYQVVREPIVGNTVSLKVDEASAAAYWQFWKGTSDDDLWNYAAHYTDIELVEIATMVQGDLEAAKTTLADNATSLLHGWDIVKRIRQDDISHQNSQNNVDKRNEEKEEGSSDDSDDDDEKIPLNLLPISVVQGNRKRKLDEDEHSTTSNLTTASRRSLRLQSQQGKG